MTVALYTNIISPHQLPLAIELSKAIGRDQYRYIYTESLHAEREQLGWYVAADILCLKANEIDAKNWLENCDVLICGHRALDLIERRCKAGKKTFYASERWFKPVKLLDLYLPGWIRMFHPRYFLMVRRFVELVKKYDNFRLLPYGVHALRDFVRIGVPMEKMTIWGYFVAPSTHSDGRAIRNPNNSLRILWVGRMLRLKNVETIVKSVRLLYDKGSKIELDLIGAGMMKPQLVRMAEGLPIHFTGSIPIDQVRKEMQRHDVYVFPSNGMDGWGAVVSEALEEGMIVLGSEEAGATATLLPPECRFKCRDYKRLAVLLRDIVDNPKHHQPFGIGDWSAKRGAERFLELCR